MNAERDNGNKPYVTVAVPCYNEEVTIGSVVLRSLKYANKVIVINDGSTDDTQETATMAGAEVIKHEKNLGKGAGIKDAFEYAKRNGTDILVVIDGDGQHKADEIPVLIEPIMKDEADIVNGSRFLKKNGNKVPIYRRIGQEVLSIATNTGTRMSITDTQNGFRAFSRKSFDTFNFSQDGMAIESEMLIDAAHEGLRIKEVPINVRYDVDGSTMDPVSHGISVLNPILGLISQKRPLLFFGVPGFLSLLIAFIFSFMIIDIFNRTKVVALGYSMIFMLFTILGTFSIFIGLMLWSIQNIQVKIK